MLYRKFSLCGFFFSFYSYLFGNPLHLTVCYSIYISGHRQINFNNFATAFELTAFSINGYSTRHHVRSQHGISYVQCCLDYLLLSITPT